MELLSEVNSSSVSNSQIKEEITPVMRYRREDYGFQLPQSYLIAMTALQQAITQRDNEIKQIQNEMKAMKKINSSLEEELEKLQKKEKDNQERNADHLSQIKLLKESLKEEQKKVIELEQKEKKQE